MQRTITLTNRPPVTVNEETWPIITSASNKEWDGQHECQANCISRWAISVRQHKDGRALIYGAYKYTSNWANSRDYNPKAGTLLPAGSTSKQICQAITEVCNDLASAEHDGDDAARWPTLAAECIADMPAESLE